MISPRRAARLGEVVLAISSAICPDPSLDRLDLAQANLPARVANLPPQMPPVHVDQPLHGHRAKPHKERYVRACLIMRQSLECADIRFLKDIGRRYSAPEPRIQSQLDHPAQPLPVHREQRRQSVSIPLEHRVHQSPEIVALVGHQAHRPNVKMCKSTILSVEESPRQPPEGATRQ